MAVSIIARGQITIVDYNDAVSLNSYIGSNQPLTQILTSDTGGFTPDWTQTPFLKLTPQLFKSGSGTDIMPTGTNVVSVTWTSSGVAVTLDGNHIKNASAPFDLTVKVNELSALTQKNYECTIVYTDINTGLQITVKSAITYTKVINAGTLITAVGYTPFGSVFKNGSAPTLTAHCDLWRGNVIDNTLVLYKWFKIMAGVYAPTTSTSATTVGGSTVVLTSVTGIVVGSQIVVGTEAMKLVTVVNTGTKIVTVGTTFASIQAAGVTVSDPRYDVKAGIGWSIINALNNYSGVTNFTTNEITIPNATVLDFETFECVIQDTDASSPTFNQVVSEILSFTDASDPIVVDITSSGGTVLRQGVGSTVLNATVWQAGILIDVAGTGYTYNWNRYDTNGIQDMTWGGSGTKTGKSITVTDPDVTGKATFYIYIQTLS